ncbi:MULTISPECIES: hypothetical protein [unclassified Myroides]|uniref:hypothetical protein n=1 Tax=unclassified Myroides TaxID=2642485 RepID=UPI003D2F723C
MHFSIKLSLVLLLLFCTQGYGQNQATPCALAQDNIEYLAQLQEEQEHAKKLDLITNKLYSDTLYKPQYTSASYLRSPYLEYVDEQATVCGKKILHVIFYNKGEESIQIDPLLHKDRQFIFEQLQVSNIDKIYYFQKGPESTSVFGAVAMEGVVVLYTTDEKIKKLIQEYSK